MKNKTPISLTLTAVLVLIVGGLIYKLTHKEVVIQDSRVVKKFAERKTFIPEKASPKIIKKFKPTVVAANNNEITISGKRYLVKKDLHAKRVMKNGIVAYREEKASSGMPILTNKNNGMKAVFTGNFMVKLDDDSLLKELIDRFGLKLVQEFKHLGTYYLGAREPQKVFENMETINNILGDSRVEYELIENPIKLK